MFRWQPKYAAVEATLAAGVTRAVNSATAFREIGGGSGELRSRGDPCLPQEITARCACGGQTVGRIKGRSQSGEVGLTRQVPQ